jgi:cutinase
VNRLTAQDKDCPNQKFALIGYSQGASVMHYVAQNTPGAIQKKILAVVMFGDPSYTKKTAAEPKFPPGIEKKVLQNCAKNDNVCDTTGSFSEHLTYRQKPWVDRTVSFITAAFKGTPLPAKTSGFGPDA